MNKLLQPLFIGLAVIGLHLSSTAYPVDLQTAQSIGAKFMGTHNLQLATTYQTDKGLPALFVFNTSDGFVIVSADNSETPIIGYSREGRFDPNNVPVQMEGYLQDFVARIQYGIENQIVADEATAKQWELVKATGQLNEQKNAKSVGPLLTSKWHQGCLYNSLCPEMSGPCDHAETGCVAVAMAQIMRYWGYPTSGWGSNSYSSYGIELTADFGNTTYDWELMPDSLTENSSEAEIEAVATLLFHCGVAVKMIYSTEGSNANSRVVPDAMKRYFNYSRQIKGKNKGNDNDQWLNLLKGNLDLQRPVYYSGSGSDGAHAFVCDGYDDNDLLHFNWGWGGNCDGYFALGSMNPNGHPLNTNNYAILDIIPQYDPCLITARVYPPEAGTIEGAGEYHIGEQCTLVATPAANSRLCYWKKGDNILSYDTSVTLNVENDIDNITACFSYQPVKEITAFHAPDTNDINSPYVSMAWDYATNNEWNLLKQFDIDQETHIATDGKHIYTAYASYSDHPGTFGKYTLDGELVEFISIDGARPDGLACDGDYFYCSKNHSYYDICQLYRYDFENKTLVDSTYMNTQFSLCAYDDNYDSFWLLKFVYANTLSLVNREGQLLYATTVTSTDGFGPFTAQDGNHHLLILSGHNCFDYDIVSNSLNIRPIAHLDFAGYSEGACIGQYDGKDAAFVIVTNYYSYDDLIKSVYIYEINCHLAPIQHYRVYRADSEGHNVMLADEFVGASFLDETWSHVNAGVYRFGISEVYHNGVESEIFWSDPIEKTDYGIDENGQEVPEQAVQKVFENGQIVIIKDGKQYNVMGQPMNQR